MSPTPTPAPSSSSSSSSTKPSRPSPTRHVQWGRRSKAAWEAHLFTLVIIPLLPLWTLINFATLRLFSGSLTSTLIELISNGPISFVVQNLPRASCKAFAGYGLWIAFQALLYTILPGRKCVGQRTPGGHVLEYTSNGMLAWLVSHAFFLGLFLWGKIDPAIIALEWEGLVLAGNVLGFVLGVLMIWKAYDRPSYPEDCKFSGSWAFDFAFGVELNPRIGERWDLKYFFNGRPGIVAWTLIDISFAFHQYNTLGFITNAMSIVILLHAIYVLDFFWNEDWYTRTIDITHDHFGWILCWGDLALLPTFYTLQAQYLAKYSSRHLETVRAALVLATGFLGYGLFRSANHQRNDVRKRNGTAKIWGRQAKVIRCSYWTGDGREHESLLLVSGWWGVVRHPNYLADLIQSFAMCATCGFGAILPWSYFFYMSILLVFRARRDDRKCRDKYGKAWDEYCQSVPCQIVPGIW